jgi:transposase
LSPEIPPPSILEKELLKRNEQLEEKVARLEKEIRLLRELRRLDLIKKYGPGSESLSLEQLELLEPEPGVNDAEVEAEVQREPIAAAAKKERKHPGRQELPAHLERVEQIIRCTSEQCACGICGQEKQVIGYETSEVLDVEPAKYFVQVTKREKRACKGCEEGGVSCAPLPGRIIEKGLGSDRVVIDAVINKYSFHLPLYRQSVILERESGLHLSRATLNGWMMRVGEMLTPIVRAMGQELLAGNYIQADETPVAVQMHDGRGKNHQAYLWQYGRPGGSTIFEFRLGRDREGPKQFLGNFEGILQSDGYTAYNQVGGPKIVYAACWAHARRKFIDAVKLNALDKESIGIVEKMDQLFRVDRVARERGLTLEARQALRNEESKPILERIKVSIEATRLGGLPQSARTKACEYTLKLWGRLTRFLDHPELELSNNATENSMRPVAIGRKNWIHVGSEQAGPRVAAIISIVETCRRLQIPVREYLSVVLPGLENFPANRVNELTPAAWFARK